MDMPLMRSEAAARITRANHLKDNVTGRFLEHKISEEQWKRIIGRMNNYIRRHIPYLL